MKINLVVLSLNVALLSACATTQSKMNDVSLGMTKQEVIGAIGSPDSTRAHGDKETLIYNPNFWHLREGWTSTKYWVVLIDGKVTEYGDEDSIRMRRVHRNAASAQPVIIDNEPPPGMPGSPLYSPPIAPLQSTAPALPPGPTTTRCHQEPGALGPNMVCETN